MFGNGLITLGINYSPILSHWIKLHLQPRLLIIIGCDRHDLELHDVCRRVEQEGGFASGAGLTVLAPVRSSLRRFLVQRKVRARPPQ